MDICLDGSGMNGCGQCVRGGPTAGGPTISTVTIQLTRALLTYRNKQNRWNDVERKQLLEYLNGPIHYALQLEQIGSFWVFLLGQPEPSCSD